jgi:MFS transporter, ACS family, hexuronate transporter
VWLAAWLLAYPKTKKPSADPGVPAVNTVREHQPVAWGILLKRREVWGIILGRFFGDPIWWLYLNWMPLYLFEARGFSLKEIAAFGWMPFVAAGVGALSGGACSGFLLRSGWEVMRSRKTTIAIGTVFLMAGFGTAFATSPYVALALICMTMFGFQFWVGNVQTLPSDLFPVGAVGSIAGFSGTAAGLGAVLLNQSTGWVVDHFSYTPILIISAVLAPTATSVLFFLTRRAVPIKNN